MNIQFDDLLKIIDQLTDEQKQIISARLAESLASAAGEKLKPRTPNLGEGTVWMSDDFDDPLSDEFWSGDDS